MMEDVYGLGIRGICRGLINTLLFADALRIGERQLLKATFNNNLPTQTGDVIVNPINSENPDSNNWLPRTQSLTIAST